MPRAVIPDTGVFPDRDTLRRWYPLLLFNVFLFFTGVGSMFFRMARDNDDVVRTGLILASGSLCTLLLATGRTRVPAALAVPALGYALTQFVSSFASVNVVESLKEFIKIGVYMLVFLTLASVAADPARRDAPLFRRTFPVILAIAGFLLGWYHTKGAPQAFPLWSTPQLTASLVTSALFCAAFAAWLSRGTVRQASFNGLAVLAIGASVLAMLQFYHLDPLRPYDPKQPYHIFVTGWPPAVLSFLASITVGELKLENGQYVLILPRILSIYGNPDFFAPYLLQFIPIAAAVAMLDPRFRRSGFTVTLLLLVTLGLTQVWGAFVGLIILSPFFGILAGAAGDQPQVREDDAERQSAILRRMLATSGIVVAAFVILWLLGAGRLALVFLVPYLGVYVGRSFSLMLPRQRVRIALGAAGAGLVLMAGVIWYLHASGFKKAAIDERIVKYRMAAEMWMRSPAIGIGLNAYKSWYPVLQPSVRHRHGWPFESLGSSATQENRAHNDIAQLLAETGVLGTGMFLWFIGAILYGGLRYLGRGPSLPASDRAIVCGLMSGVAVIIIYSLPNFPFHIVSSAGTFWFMAGLLASYSAPAPPPDAGNAPGKWPPPRLRKLLVSASLVTFALTAAYGAKIFIGTLLYRLANPNPSVYKMPPNPPEAAKYYEKALEYDVDNGQYVYEYGVMCFNLFKTDPELGPRARPLLRKARRLGFMCDDLAYGLGHIAQYENDYDSALKWFSLAIELNERHPGARYAQEQLLLREMADAEKAAARRKFGLAQKLYAAALEKNPSNHLAAYKLGVLSVTIYQDTEAAIRHLGDAARIAATHAPYYVALAQVLVMAQRVDEAYAALRKASALDPNNDVIRNNVARMRQFLESRRAAASP